MALLDRFSAGILPGEKSFPGGITGGIGDIARHLPIPRLPQGLGRLSGIVSTPKLPLDVGAMTFRDQNGTPIESDWRVRIGFPDGLAQSLYSRGLMAPLMETNGVVFPYTPNISINYSADWQGQRLTQSNYTPLFYSSSDVQDMTISGQFTAMNAAEARYLLAVITFCRLATKMFFGTGENAGNPPPILHLNGYGKHHFNNVPVALKMANYQLPGDVDYISAGTDENVDYSGYGVTGQPGAAPATASGDNTRVPTDMMIAFTVQPIYSRRQVSTFNYNQFASGEMITRGFI